MKTVKQVIQEIRQATPDILPDVLIEWAEEIVDTIDRKIAESDLHIPDSEWEIIGSIITEVKKNL